MVYSTNPYCTEQQVYNALDLSFTSQGADGTWIQELIVEAQSALDRELGFSFQTDGTTGSPSNRLYDGHDTEILVSQFERILSVSQVLETTYNVYLSSQGVYISGTTQTTDITADVVLGPSYAPNGSMYLRRKTSGNVFAQGTQNYSVFGVFGRPMIPPDITRACVRLAVHYYKQRDTNYADLLQEQGNVRVRYTKVMPDDVVEIIERYKPRVFLVGG